VNETLGRWAENFIGLFAAGGETFVGLVTGIIPLLIVLLTAVNALIRLIGVERIDRVGEIAGRPGLRYYPIRYLVLPVLAVFFLTNPMAYTMGRFLPESRKPAFYDSAVSFVHPILGLFPHANPAELFVYLGIATGVQRLGLPLGDLAVRYFYVGLIVIFMRGVVTEIITNIMLGRKARGDESDEELLAEMHPSLSAGGHAATRHDETTDRPKTTDTTEGA
jgi:PTS system glucitol/sorbitol-specific IIC component